MITTMDRPATRQPVIRRPATRRRSDELQFRLIYGATFPAFLLGALARRAMSSKPSRATGRAAPGLSVFGEAKAAARTCGSFALMG